MYVNLPPYPEYRCGINLRMLTHRAIRKKARHTTVTSLSKYPRQDLNLCLWLRRPTLYPLSYGGRNTGIE